MQDPKAHWEAVYATRAADAVSWYQAEPRLSLEMISASGVAADQPLIDVGGGASVLVDRLLERGYRRLTVLDIAGSALAEAKRRLGERADAVEWVEADVTDFHPAERFALWHDRAVFHFLTDPTDQDRYRASLERSLAPGGQLVLASFAVGGPTRCSGLEIVQYDEDRLMDRLGEGFELLEAVPEVHTTPSGGEQSFMYFRLVRRDPP